MHVMILNVMAIRLLIIMGTESSQTFIAEIGLNWIYTSNNYIETTIKLFLWLLTTLHKRFLQMPNMSIRYQRTEKFSSQET